jgi:hypothetical protein
MKTLIALILALGVLQGCTDQNVARNYGGTATIKNPDPEHLVFVSASWKDTSMWVVWFNSSKNECIYKENSSYGVYQGAIIIQECNFGKVLP